MFKCSNVFYLSICIALLASCNTTKYVPEGDALYKGATVEIINSVSTKKLNTVLHDDIKGILRPKPNTKFLGIRFKLGLYNMAGKKNNFINRFLRNKGEPPVLLSQLSLNKNLELVINTMQNKGFFHATATVDTIVKGKYASAKFKATPGVQYKINEVSFPADSSVISNVIKESANQSLLQKGKPFILDVIKGERLRIDAILKERGFYFFNPEDLIVLVDSTVGNTSTNLYVQYKKDMPGIAKKQFTINNIFIYSNYNLNSAATDTLKVDSVFFKHYYVIDKSKMFKPLLFEQMMLFKPGDLYNRTNHNLSLNRLINLGTFKFVKNRFETVTNSFKLNTYYYLTPLPKKHISAELGGLTKSNNVTGTELTLRWQNRNTFNAAELLSAKIYFGSEVQYSGQFSGYNTLRYGIETNLTLPRFIIPFFRFNTTSSFVPRTNIQLGYDILQRQKLYSLNSYKFNFGYVWKESVYKEHTLNPIAINYVQPLNVTQLYKDSIEGNPILQRTVEQQFTIGSTYNFNYNQLVNSAKNATGLYFNGLLDLSGNIAGLVSGADIKNGKQISLFGSPFSQYIKGEFDTRYYIGIGNKSQWANRLIIGAALPYGNSSILPFVKQFFVGGNNSLRGFRSRSVGPGTFYGGQSVNAKGFFPDMTGDIKFEINSEFRTNLTSIFDAAVFADAGNIWLYNDNADQPGGKFSNKFLSQLAIDMGVGLRIDLTILILRLDIAIPVRKPWLPDGQQNVFNQIDLGNSDWRRQNVIYNLAIGLPF